MKKIVDFLGRLSRNNDRVWFQAHKDEYLECKNEFDILVAKIVEGIRGFDSTIGPLTPKDCTYRIYRDTRFSADKSPYKRHFGAFIVREGKKSGYSGYYFQVGPDDSGFDSGCMLATGNYCFAPAVIKLLREDIALDEGAEFGGTLDAAGGFALDWSGALKRVPAGFEADKPYSQWLRLRNFCLLKEPGVGYMLADDLAERVVADFATTRPFLDFINRAVEYARDEGSVAK